MNVEREVTGRECDRIYTCSDYLDLLNEGTELPRHEPDGVQEESAVVAA